MKFRDLLPAVLLFALGLPLGIGVLSVVAALLPAIMPAVEFGLILAAVALRPGFVRSIRGK